MFDLNGPGRQVTLIDMSLGKPISTGEGKTKFFVTEFFLIS